MHAQRSPRYSLFFLALTFLALVALGAWQARWDFLTRGILVDAPLPVLGGGAAWGVNVSLEQYSPAELDENLAQMAGAGFTHIKQSFYWRDNFDWETSDRLFAAATRHHLTLIPLLDGDPANQFAPPDDPNQFAAWAGEFARRYGATAEAYIIWDEPNLTSHWGNQPVNPDEYVALLAAASQAIRTHDSTAHIVAAPLAPTIETGPKNLADPLFLQAMYEAGAAAFFDIVAGKPYGFDHGPAERTVDLDTLNFSRIILLREVMERSGDGHKAVWAGNWGWNALPSDWTGSPSVWGQTSAETQMTWTLAGFDRARQEWPWMGVMFVENWEPFAAADDPRWGFSLKRWVNAETLPPADETVAFPGFHLASNTDPTQQFEGGWRFSPEYGADISQSGDSVSLSFWGTDVAVRVRRADFRARFYATVDGQPANALPRDENGSTLVLTAPDPAEDYLALLWVARDLEPGPHTLTLTADRGWDQWALNGFSVLYRPDDTAYRWGMVGWAAAALSFLALAIYTGRGADWGRLGQTISQTYHRVSLTGQLFLTGLAGLLVGVGGWLTWGAQMEGLYRRLGEGGQIGLTVAAAFLFYVAPSFYLYSLGLITLFVLLYLRPTWGLVLIAFTIPFRLVWSKTISQYTFSLLEIFTVLTAAAFVLKWGVSSFEFRVSSFVGAGQPGQPPTNPPNTRSRLSRPQFRVSRADGAVLGLLVVGTLSLFFTERLDVATNEWRWLIVEPVLFYAVFRLSQPTRTEFWLILDAFILGGLVMALIGLFQYATGSDQLITAEGGLMRLRSVYGSPNNVALYLGRVLPIAVAVGMWRVWSFKFRVSSFKSLVSSLQFLSTRNTQHATRPWLYLAAAFPMLLAFLLTFSKGGLLLGLPAAFLVLFVVWQRRAGRRVWPWLVGLVVVGAIGLLVAMQIPALAGRLNPQITGFFRLYLWQASLEMIREHPWLGVGLDNFLYAYRGRYILNAAWQEPNLSHPHNLVLDFATRLGLLGLMAGGWLFWQLGQKVRATISEPPSSHNTEFWPVAVGIAGSLAYMLAHSLVDHGYFLVDLAFAFHLLLALAQTNPSSWVGSDHF
jgi:O-antigen ligase